MHNSCLIIFLYCFCLSHLLAQTKSTSDSRSVLDSPVEFTDTSVSNYNQPAVTEIRIGLFLPTSKADRSENSFQNAADLAIKELNENGGYNGLPFVLVNRWAADPWQSGSKEMIKLVYQDSVWAVIGSIDGDATHIAEQIATKSWIPLISPLSADPTLTYIRIPWIFRLPPDYKTQARVIVRQGLKNHKDSIVGLITEINHDGRIFAQDMNEVLNEQGIVPRFHFEMSDLEKGYSSIVHRLLSFKPSSIIICLSKDNILKLLSELKNHTQKIDVFIPWIPGLDYDIITDYYSGKMHYIEPFLRSANPDYEKFASKYYNRFGSKPTFGAAYTYDAVYILSGALQKSGLNRVRLRKFISIVKNFHGVTGKISWDNGGGNKAQPIYRSLFGGDYD